MFCLTLYQFRGWTGFRRRKIQSLKPSKVQNVTRWQDWRYWESSRSFCKATGECRHGGHVFMIKMKCLCFWFLVDNDPENSGHEPPLEDALLFAFFPLLFFPLFPFFHFWTFLLVQHWFHGTGKVLMCMDKFENCSYTKRIWCIFEAWDCRFLKKHARKKTLIASLRMFWG